MENKKKLKSNMLIICNTIAVFCMVVLIILMRIDKTSEYNYFNVLMFGFIRIVLIWNTINLKYFNYNKTVWIVLLLVVLINLVTYTLVILNLFFTSYYYIIPIIVLGGLVPGMIYYTSIKNPEHVLWENNIIKHKFKYGSYTLEEKMLMLDLLFNVLSVVVFISFKPEKIGHSIINCISSIISVSIISYLMYKKNIKFYKSIVWYITVLYGFVSSTLVIVYSSPNIYIYLAGFILHMTTSTFYNEMFHPAKILHKEKAYGIEENVEEGGGGY